MPKKNVSKYLEKLKFQEKFKSTATYKYLTNIRYVILILFAIIPVGIYSMLTLPRTLNPEVNLPFISVTTTLPGASPEEIEKLITIPIEDAVENISGVVNVDSSSSENFSNVVIEFSSRIDTDQAKQEVQNAIDSISDLPDDSTTPRVVEFDIENEPIVTYAFTNESDPASLYIKTKELKEKIESLREVDKVETKGLPDYEISIEIKPEIAKTYNINPLLLQEKIKQSLSSFPSGNVESNGFNFSVSLARQVEDIETLRKLPISIQGDVVLLGFIAEIKEINVDSSSNYVYENSEFDQAVVFDVYRNKSIDITKAVNSVNDLVEDYIDNNNLKSRIISSTALDISREFTNLFYNFAVTLLLVFTTLFVFLGIRQSSIVALSIPISFLISFTVMQITGLTLNFLTVFSLLLALGLLVDDAIVIVSAMTSYMRTKKFNPAQAGTLVWRDFIVPIWSTTITTVWAFFPLLLATGIIGEFIKTIPIVVSATLIASTTVAVLITLPFAIQIFDLRIPKRVILSLKILTTIILIFAYPLIIPTTPIYLFVISYLFYLLFLLSIYLSGLKIKFNFSNTKSKKIYQILKFGLVDSENLSNWYKNFIDKILSSKKNRRSVIAFVIIFSVLSYTLVPLGFVVNEFFPKTDSNILFINLELPSGSNNQKTDNEIKNIARQIPEIEGIENILVSSTLENNARLTLRLDENKISSIELADNLRELYKDYTKGKVTIEELSGGPPVGSDIEISLEGEDLVILDRLTNDIKVFLDNEVEVVSTEKSISPSASRLVFQPDLNQLEKYKVSLGELGLWLRAYVSGYNLDKSTFDGDQIDIVYRFSPDALNLSELNLIEIPTQNGNIPIFALGEFIAQTNPERIDRSNGKRRVSVSASVSAGSSVTELNTRLDNFVSELDMPDGYQTVSGGVNQENQESVNSILQAMLLSSLLILATMVLQLGSFRKAIIVLLVIPLAVSGVFVIFAITQTPLSFPALIGLLALFGIVVNNSIVVVEKINQNLKVGIKFRDSITDAAASRVEPIIFSSITTIMGLAPITITDPLWRGLGGAIIAGLLVSGTIMLLFIPVVYYSWFEEDYKDR